MPVCERQTDTDTETGKKETMQVCAEVTMQKETERSRRTDFGETDIQTETRRKADEQMSERQTYRQGHREKQTNRDQTDTDRDRQGDRQIKRAFRYVRGSHAETGRDTERT